jgi:hypothetical protein
MLNCRSGTTAPGNRKIIGKVADPWLDGDSDHALLLRLPWCSVEFDVEEGIHVFLRLSDLPRLLLLLEGLRNNGISPTPVSIYLQSRRADTDLTTVRERFTAAGLVPCQTFQSPEEWEKCALHQVVKEYAPIRQHSAATQVCPAPPSAAAPEAWMRIPGIALGRTAVGLPRRLRRHRSLRRIRHGVAIRMENAPPLSRHRPGYLAGTCRCGRRGQAGKAVVNMRSCPALRQHLNATKPPEEEPQTAPAETSSRRFAGAWDIARRGTFFNPADASHEARLLLRA